MAGWKPIRWYPEQLAWECASSTYVTQYTLLLLDGVGVGGGAGVVGVVGGACGGGGVGDGGIVILPLMPHITRIKHIEIGALTHTYIYMQERERERARERARERGEGWWQ